MAKTEFLQIRISPEDRERFDRISAAEHLDVSTWARRIILQAAERWEANHPGVKKVAEGPNKPSDPRRR